MLKGTIYITNNIEYIYNIPLSGNIKIINLDEDGVLVDSQNIVGGLCLLPPIEAKIAEADGNEQRYDTIYSSYLLEPYQQKFISALIAFLYKGGNLIIYLPEIGYNNTQTKLIQHLYTLFGIHIGIIGSPNPQDANCYYDDRCIPIWLNMIYSSRVITAQEYLYEYPDEIPIVNENIMSMLIDELRPYGETISDKMKYIERLHHLIKVNPKVIPAIHN